MEGRRKCYGHTYQIFRTNASLRYSDDFMTAYRLQQILRTRKLNNLQVNKLRVALKSGMES